VSERAVIVLSALPRRSLEGLIRAYQWAAAAVPSPCRFTPTCSSYALDAVRRYGAVRGGWLAVRRIVRCHPFGGSGYDPVP
jgi:putative membrane protein insertion efficiency factor